MLLIYVLQQRDPNLAQQTCQFNGARAEAKQRQKVRGKEKKTEKKKLALLKAEDGREKVLPPLTYKK